MREAQRNYRARKGNTVKAAVEKAATLESTLSGVLDCFKELQTKLARDCSYLPPGLARQLALTSVDVSYFSRNDTLNTAESASRSDDDQKLHAGRIFAKRLLDEAMASQVNMDEGITLFGIPTPMSLQSGQSPTDQNALQIQEVVFAGNALHLNGASFRDACSGLQPVPALQLDCSEETAPTAPHLLSPGTQNAHMEEKTDSIGSEQEWVDLIDVHTYLADRGIALPKDGPQATLIRLHVGSSVWQSPAEYPEVASDTVHYSDYISLETINEISENQWEPTESFAAGSFCADLPNDTIQSDFTELHPLHEEAQPADCQNWSITINTETLIHCLASKIARSRHGVGMESAKLDEAIQNSVVPVAEF